MLVFLDFEASSLSNKSYPIEIGWVFEDGRTEQHLIRPAPAWTEWDPAAEETHGLSRARLFAEGDPHDLVARRVLRALSGHELYASAPSWDGMWMSMLLRGAGLPRHALRVKRSDEALAQAAAPAGPRAEAIVAEARKACEDGPPRHRALDDAVLEWRIWCEVKRRVGELPSPQSP